MNKKRILLINEFCLNRTGYSAIGKELLTRLYNSGKYEIAELAIYAKVGDHRIDHLPWKVFPVIPSDDDVAGKTQYNSRPDAEMGGAIFEDILIKYKPDIVVDIRDIPWMSTYQALSPLRQYYSLLWMPTIDATPQQDEWINQYCMADRLLTYTDFGYRTLAESMGTSKLLGATNPGADSNIFRPLDKRKIKNKYGLSENIKLIGMLSRNQLRKLYPDLLEMFRIFLEKAPSQLANETFLHLHTSYPDQGWNIPRLLKQHGLSHKVYFTYLCHRCGEILINKWNDYNLPCKNCGNRSMVFTSPQYGVKQEKLVEIYNLYDLYIQYAALEGLGMGQPEVGLCGVPMCSIPYSAMEDFVNKTKSFPVPIAKKVSENVTHRLWAYPNNEEFANNLIDILSNRDLVKWGQETRELCLEHYDWNKTIKIWENALDNMPLPAKSWNSPPVEIIEKPVNPNQDPISFVKDCFLNIANAPFLCDGFLLYRMSTDLYNGFTVADKQNKPYNQQSVIDFCRNYQNGIKHWDNIRCQSST